MAGHATQYLLPEGIGLDAALARLAARLDIASGPAVPAQRTFYDTFDGRLHAAGLALIGEAGRLVAVAGVGCRELAAAPGVPAEGMFVWDLPGGALHDLIEPIVEVRALRAIARTRGRARALRVLNREEKTVVRLVLESASSLAGAAELPLRSRLHVIGVRGYDRALGRVRRALSEELGLEVAVAGLHDEAVRAAGGTPGGIATNLDLRLTGGEPAVFAAAIALGQMLATIKLTLPGVLDDVDTEFLHDLRVAVRRTRSIQRQLFAAFPANRLDRVRWFRGEFRWLGLVTGPTRDLDVLLLDFARLADQLPGGRAAELRPMEALLRARRELERQRMAAALGSERTDRLLTDWADFLADLGTGARQDVAAAHGRGVAGSPVSALVGGRIRNVYRRMCRTGEAIDDGTPAERLHDLRKQGKELRYLLEIFAGLYPTEAVRPTVKALKALQETLGQFQDREVQASTLRSLGEELVVVEGGPAALIALGVVLERIEAESLAARAEFGERFAVYSAAGQRAVIRRAFR